MAKRIKYNQNYIFIEKKGDEYFPYIDRYSCKMGKVSPGLFRLFSQEELKKAYETETLKPKLSKGEE